MGMRCRTQVVKLDMLLNKKQNLPACTERQAAFSCFLLVTINNTLWSAHHFKGITVAGGRFRTAQKKITTGIYALRNTVKDITLEITGKIDQNIPAEDDIELTQAGETIEEIELLKTDTSADFGFNLPYLILFSKKLLFAFLGKTTAE